MKCRYFLVFVASMITSVLIFNACSEEDITNALTEMTCDLITTPTVLVTEAQVTYSAIGTGTASITNLVYMDADGNAQTVNSPDLPWSITLTMPAGKTVEISAVGITLNGELEIKYYGSGGNVTYTSSDNCSQSSN